MNISVSAPGRLLAASGILAAPLMVLSLAADFPATTAPRDPSRKERLSVQTCSTLQTSHIADTSSKGH